MNWQLVEYSVILIVGRLLQPVATVMQFSFGFQYLKED